jgi:hypothetical protein
MQMQFFISQGTAWLCGRLCNPKSNLAITKFFKTIATKNFLKKKFEAT